LFILSSARPLRVLTSAPLGHNLQYTRHIFNTTVSRYYDNPNPLADLEAIAR